MNRRQYLERLAATSTVGVVAIAGCGSPGDGAAVTPDETEPDGTSPAGEPTQTPGDAGTASPTETTPADGQTATPGGGEVPNEIAMITDGGDQIFDPVGLYVEPGETITWVNESGAHSSTAYTEENPQSSVNRIPDDASGWDSGILSEQGGEFTHTFEVEGTYDYYCIPHMALGMVGRLVVGEPSGLEDDPPNGTVPAEQRIVDQGAVTQEEFNP